MNVDDLKINDEITVKLKLVLLDDSLYSHGFQIVGMPYEDGETELWLSKENIEQAQEGANPEIKKARIQREIEALQKQLEELE